MERQKALKTMASIRDRWQKFFTSGISISTYQAPFLKDVPARGPMWVSRVTLPGGGGGGGGSGNNGIVRAVEEAIAELGDGSETYDVPECVDLQGEWVGYRSGVEKSTEEPRIAEEEKYDRLAEELGNDAVLYYIHGGAGYAGSNAVSRPLMSNLASRSRSRVFAVNYRLAPQSSFPVQIVDVLLGYLYVLHPPPGSLHKPVPASKMVFVADSFGAVLFLALTKLILVLRKNTSGSSSEPVIHFHGQDVPLPLPAGLAFVSPYSYTPDIYPSWENNTVYDWFPVTEYPLVRNPKLKFCEAWPTKPLRGDLYCDISMLGHPLVCLSAITSWKGCPPVYMASGQELCLDAAKAIATQMVKDGVTVCWEEYEAMPHVFMTFLPKWKESSMCYDRWIGFCKKCLEGGEIKREGFIVGCEDLEIRKVDVEALSEYDPDYAVRNIELRKRERTEWLEKFKIAKSLL